MNHSLADLRRALRVSASGYHAWLSREPSRRAQDDVRLATIIAAIHYEHREAYGSRRLWRVLSQHESTQEGVLMLAIILDVHSRRVVGWAMDTHQRVELTECALQMALQHHRPTAGLILHHDRGSQYTAARYWAKAEAAKITLSMSRTRVPYDNAVAESFFATLKLELMECVKYASREDAKQAAFEYLEIFYNRVRLHSSLGYRTPLQAERDYLKIKSVS